MRLSIDGPMPMARVVSTPALTAPWNTAASSAARFGRTVRPLPSMFRTPMVAHELSPRVPAPARLKSLVAALRGRLAVVNLSGAARLPGGLVTAMCGLVRMGCNRSAIDASERWDPVALYPSGSGHSRSARATDARVAHERRMTHALVSTIPSETRARFPDQATWVALALYESASPVVRLASGRSADNATEARHAVASAEIDYRLVIAIGAGAPTEWSALDAASVTVPAAAWPTHRRPDRDTDAARGADRYRPWFSTPLLVPDRWFAAHADAETLAAWARLTGRSGVPDRYWFPETWDRFLEPGRRVGWLTVADVWRPRPGCLSSGSAARADHDLIGEQDPVVVRHPPPTLTPDLERGVGLPPGYALVQCIGRLSVSFVVCRG